MSRYVRVDKIVLIMFVFFVVCEFILCDFGVLLFIVVSVFRADSMLSLFFSFVVAMLV